MSPIKDVPRVIWPTETSSYKAVQLYVDNEPYLRFGNVCARHAAVLQELLDSLGIEYKITMLIFRREGPAPEGISEGVHYKVAGMGLADINIKSKSADFYGNSGDYVDAETNAEHLDAIKDLYPEWTIKP